MQHILTLSRTGVIVRHWFEIDQADASMEHGVRIELRELAAHPRRGSESAAQLVAVDRPLWRADLFDRLTDAPGTFGVAHYHPRFLGDEPCPRVWDAKLTADPWSWLGDQFAQLGAAGGTEPWPVDPADGPELSRLAAEIVSLARQLGPDRCGSAARCYELTWDAAESVRLMIGYLRRPDLLDEDRVAPWRGTGVQDGPSSPPSPLPCPGTPGLWRYGLIADCAVSCQPGACAARPIPHPVPVATHPAKDEPIQMTATEPGLPASVTENPLGPGCPDGRVLALRCLGIPQVITRAPVSRRRGFARKLVAFCARIRPGNTAELASLVLYMGEEIDRRERMLDAALRATAEVPGERAKGAYSERVA